MDEEQLEEYVSRSERVIEESPQMDEANTKVRLIQPLVSILGWNVHSGEVELEYPVQMGAGTKKVDYALMLEETPVVFIEAKGCDTSLTEAHRDQLKSYMRIVGVDWGVLTNGQYFEILKRRPDTTRPDEITLGEFHIEELGNKFHLVNALSKESIKTGEAETIAENIERIRDAVAVLQSNKDEIASEIVDVVTTTVGKSVPVKIEDDAKEFVDDLIVSFQSHGPHSVRSGGINSGVTHFGGDADFWPRVENELGISLSQNGISLNDELNAVENFIAFVEFLFDDGYVSREDLPYNPGGPKRYLLNTSPTHVDGSDMFQPRKVYEGIFLETHNSTDDKKRHMKRLAEEFVEG